MILLILSGFLSACQKPVPEVIEKTQKTQEDSNTTPDLTLICQNLKEEMLKMNAQRTTLALEQINQDIRLCLPLMKYPEQKDLMSRANQMYTQFLEIDRTPEQQEAFINYVLDQALYPTIQQSQFEKLNLRDQYLLRHQGQAYIEIFDIGNEQVMYRRHPQYLAKVFAPYLPEAEKAFIEGLAQQNAQPFAKDHKLNIQPNEISLRALFWENYLKVYPKSSLSKDAQYLYQFYSALLFRGLTSSIVSERYDQISNIQESSLAEIQYLTKQKESVLADQARHFLIFVSMTPAQRKQKIKLNPSTYQKNRADPHLLAIAQLNQYLSLQEINLDHPKLDCFSDAICHH